MLKSIVIKFKQTKINLIISLPSIFFSSFMTLGDRLVFKISVIAEQQTVDESLVGEETDVGASAQQEFCQF